MIVTTLLSTPDSGTTIATTMKRGGVGEAEELSLNGDLVE